MRGLPLKELRAEIKMEKQDRKRDTATHRGEMGGDERQLDKKGKV